MTVGAPISQSICISKCNKEIEVYCVLKRITIEMKKLLPCFWPNLILVYPGFDTRSLWFSEHISTEYFNSVWRKHKIRSSFWFPCFLHVWGKSKFAIWYRSFVWIMLRFATCLDMDKCGFRFRIDHPLINNQSPSCILYDWVVPSRLSTCFPSYIPFLPFLSSCYSTLVSNPSLWPFWSSGPLPVW